MTMRTVGTRKKITKMRSNMLPLALAVALALSPNPAPRHWMAAHATMAVAAATSEATIDEYGNVITSDAVEAPEVPVKSDEPPPRPDEEIGVYITNESPYRVDIYWDDGHYGAHTATLERKEKGAINTFVGHSFFVTRHGTKEGLFVFKPIEDGGEGKTEEERLLFKVSKRNEQFVIPSDAAPSTDPCHDRFSICATQAKRGGCESSPGWMIVHCCKSCDPYLNSSKLIDPKARCSKEHLKTPDPIWKPGDMNAMFESWATNETLKKLYDFEVVSSPDPEKFPATWSEAKKGSPWVVLFNNFLDENEVADLIRGGELEGYERSTDQGAANALGEQEKIVSRTRTSSNAWCMHRCERLPGVRSATGKIEEVTGIPHVNYESFQLLNYEKNQFYRSHHDSSRTDETPAGPRILTFFLYLTDVELGGETYFNKLDLAVKPKKGRALVWPSVVDDNPHLWDARMFHEAKDVVKGQKLAANHWIHLNDYHTPNDWGCTGSFS